MAWPFLLFIVGACRQPGVSSVPRSEPVTLRVGIGQVASGTPIAGLDQLRQILTAEALVNFSVDGRPHAWLADSWAIEPEGLTLRLQLREHVTFHDGSPMDASTVAKILLAGLPDTMGATFDAIEDVRVIDSRQVEIRLRYPSPLVLEALQQQAIRRPGGTRVGTGPFVDSFDGQANEIRANEGYYLGRPGIDRVVVDTYPSLRAAWADLLRDRLDMLYEVGLDALNSLEDAKEVALFAYTRSYQFVLAFNAQAPTLRSAAIRRALGMAIDRQALIRDAFEGRAEPSFGPVSTRHWAYRKGLAAPKYDPRIAVELLGSSPGGRTLRFVCLVPPDSERVALVVRRQLQAVGVDMELRELSPDEFLRALRTNQFDAALTEFRSGPTLFNLYGVWHSGGLIPHLGTSTVDRALDQVRHATSDEEYAAGVANLQRAVVDDPPGIFLAWSQRARAVRRRFDIPVDPDRDILGTLRLWRRATTEQAAARNKN